MDETNIPALTEEITVTVVQDPAHNLPLGIRNKLNAALVNGLMTANAAFLRYVICNLAAVLMARAEEHAVKQIIKDLQEMYDGGTGQEKSSVKHG